MNGEIWFRATVLRFSSKNVVITEPSAASSREFSEGRVVLSSLGSESKKVTEFLVSTPVAPAAGSTRPAASSPPAMLVATKAPIRPRALRGGMATDMAHTLRRPAEHLDRLTSGQLIGRASNAWSERERAGPRFPRSQVLRHSGARDVASTVPGPGARARAVIRARAVPVTRAVLVTAVLTSAGADCDGDADSDRGHRATLGRGGGHRARLVLGL